MKYLAMTAAALFLLAAPAISFAQSDNNGNNDGGGNAGSGTNAGGGNNDAGTAATGGSTASQQGGDSQCNDQTPTSGYASFSEKCRLQIDTWAAGQAGKGAAYEGDVAVGVVVPDTVEIIEVPVYKDYGYVMLNDRRVLVDRNTRKIVRIY